MVASSHTSPRVRRAGISLLEVLISIGILSIGLVSVLALIPAGRTQLSKAAVDDRAALLVPNAYATMRTLGLFSFNALSWTDKGPSDWFVPDEPPSVPVIRNVTGVGDVFGKSSVGSTVSDCWSIVTIDTETITSWHSLDPFPYPRISGTVKPVEGPTPPGRQITISTSPVSPLGGETTSDPTSGKWVFPVTGVTLAAPDMQIFTSGSKVGQVSNTPWTDYQIIATYSGTAGSENANPDPASYRQYGRRRSVDHRTGHAKITYVAPPNATDVNPGPTQAAQVPMATLENVTLQGRGEIARSVSTNIRGTLWRMELGTRHGIYSQDVDFGNVNDAPPQPRAASFPDDDITRNAGFTWLDGSGNAVPPSPAANPPIPEVREDVDWYRIDVDAGDVLRVAWNDYSSPSALLEESGRPFPLYLNTTSPSPAKMLVPFERGSGANYELYSIPNDGFVITRAQLKPLAGNLASETDRNANIPNLLNTFGPAGASLRVNPTYDITLTRSRTDRVIVIDPLMATRLDKIIQLNGGAGRLDPYYLRRHRFADFQQTLATGGTPRAFIIPRLNWQKFTVGDTDTMLAMAEKLFRDQDNLALDPAANDDLAPAPRFDVDAAAAPVRRMAEGRMSWLLMIQPEDPGPVAANWQIGKYFDVSVVVFQDRRLPPVAAGPALDGEYALSGAWSDLDGMLTVSVPPSGATVDLDDDDLRDLFHTGAWVLLAPQTNYDTSPLDSTQRLDWVRIQSARIERQAGGGFTVGLLLDTEPADTILYRSKRPPAVQVSPLVVLAYPGVVTVVSKTMRLEP